MRREQKAIPNSQPSPGLPLGSVSVLEVILIYTISFRGIKMPTIHIIKRYIDKINKLIVQIMSTVQRNSYVHVGFT